MDLTVLEDNLLSLPLQTSYHFPKLLPQRRLVIGFRLFTRPYFAISLNLNSVLEIKKE